MQFGNWKVDDKGISWTASGFQRFEIPGDQLNKTMPDSRSEGLFYEWIMLATAEDWLTQNDLYDLNYAFIYAAAKFNVDFNYNIFDSTLEEQYEQFDAEDDEDPDL